MKHLQSFRYIKAIVEEGSIRSAAETLTISASALNRHIQNLEEDMGTPLFERLTKGVRLSSAGEYFYTYALGQMAAYDRVRDQIQKSKGLNLGVLRLGVTEDFSVGFLHPLIAQLQRDNVNCDVSIISVQPDRIYDALESRQVDLVMAVNPNIRRGLQVLHGANVDLAAFVPRGMPVGSDGVLNIYDLQGLRIATPPETTEVAQRITAAIERDDIEVMRHYSGPDLLQFLEHAFSPVVGLTIVIEQPDKPTVVTGYKRLRVATRELGTCNFCLLAFESYGLSLAAHSFQAIASAYFNPVLSP